MIRAAWWIGFVIGLAWGSVTVQAQSVCGPGGCLPGGASYSFQSSYSFEPSFSGLNGVSYSLQPRYRVRVPFALETVEIPPFAEVGPPLYRDWYLGSEIIPEYRPRIYSSRLLVLDSRAPSMRVRTRGRIITRFR